jgi:N-methylhydantoinase A
MVDMHTIGAGGGSLASIDRGGMLHVGPESAGASPGPACYGLGGSRATVTDANVVLGRLRPDRFLGGAMALNPEAAWAAVAGLARQLDKGTEEMAEGIIRLANEHMSRALRAISIERGHDPTGFTLCCFGGAGGLHVCDLAEQLGLTMALIPVNAGVLSALGMLVAPRERQLSRTLNHDLLAAVDEEVDAALTRLAKSGIEELLGEGVVAGQITSAFSLDLRYRGQSFTLNVTWQGSARAAAQQFDRQHEARYGHVMELPVELVNLRAAVTAPAPALSWTAPWTGPATAEHVTLYGVDEPVLILQREMLQIGRHYGGPLLITEQISTTWIKPGWAVTRDECGNLLLEMMNSQHRDELPPGE